MAALTRTQAAHRRRDVRGARAAPNGGLSAPRRTAAKARGGRAAATRLEPQQLPRGTEVVTEPGPAREAQRRIISDFESAVLEGARTDLPPPVAPHTAEARERLDREGYVYVGRVLDDSTCDALWEHVSAPVEEAASGKGLLGGAKARVDVKLRMEGAAKQAAREALGTYRLVDLLLAAATEDAYLCEFGVLCSYPGANRQPVHPDTVCTGRRGERPIFTTFVALQDVTVAMGPTRLLVGTNTVEAHRAASDVTSEAYRALLATPNVDATLAKGHALVFDSRTLHAGGANEAAPDGGRRRCLLYLSAQGPEEGCSRLPTSPERRTPPNAYSIVPELHNKLRVREYAAFC